MSRKKEETPSLRERVKAFQRNLEGEASKKFAEVLCQHTEASCVKEALAQKNLQKAFAAAKAAIVGLPGSLPKDEVVEDD